jgi:tripartite-type tricarboxylate transporter receptor subunit TctC
MANLAFLLIGAALVIAPGFAGSEAYPSRPIRFIVPIAAGSGPDITARLLAPDLSRQMGQQVIVDNRPGASSVIGMELVARSAPDGYTIGYGPATILAVVPSLLGKMPYDTDRDLQMVMQLGYTPNLLVVSLSLTVKSVRELVDYAKRNPGKLTSGSSLNG